MPRPSKLEQPVRLIAGLSLLELMISIAIGTAVLLIIFKILGISQQQWHHQSQDILIQDRLQLAQWHLQRDLRMAGFAGCNSFDRLNQAISLNAITGATESTSASDTLTIRYAATEGSFLRQSMQNTRGRLWLAKPVKISANAHWVISDCQKMDSFTIFNHSQTIASQLQPRTLQRIYQQNAYVAPLIQHRYFIKQTQRTNTEGQPILSLYQENHLGQQELIEQIDSLKISYVLSSSPLIFLPANKVQNWQHVNLVKIQIASQGQAIEFYTHLRNQQ